MEQQKEQLTHYMLATVPNDLLDAAKRGGSNCDECKLCKFANFETSSPITEEEAHTRAREIAEDDDVTVTIFKLKPIGSYSIDRPKAKFTPIHKEK